MNTPKPSERLQEAVSAMRNFRAMPARQWRDTYHSFTEATEAHCHGGLDLNTAMSTELQLRTAECVLAMSLALSERI
jgi:hypothetical protein